MLDRKPFGFLLSAAWMTVFRALADPTRRALLDALFERDGQTLVALSGRPRDDPGRRREAPAAARGRRPRRQPAPRPREAALPQPGPDPAHPRPLGEQVHRAVGRRAHRSEARTGAVDGEGVRDLHPHDAGAPLGGDHRPGDPCQVPLRRRASQSDWTPGSRLRSWPIRVGRTTRRGREPRRRPAAAAGPVDDGPLERRREGRGHRRG